MYKELKQLSSKKQNKRNKNLIEKWAKDQIDISLKKTHNWLANI